MNDLTFGKIQDLSLEPLKPPGLRYLFTIAILGAVVTGAIVIWIIQQKVGMQVTGLNNPVGWGIYIGNYVYWIAVAMSGTFISAMLYLVRSRFRSSISRGAETMTVIAVAIAGLFPLIHLGRLWVVYFMVPYPQGLQVWPNFTSPLVWDMLAIFTYMVTSWIIYYMGIIPDAASAWHKEKVSPGPHYLRAKIHRLLAMNWHGAASQWRHYKRSYLFLAAMATPLAVSIHSVTSWDFSMQLLKGWHTTLFAPYFVCGAILSGSGYTMILLVPLRNAFNLKSIIKTEHLASLSLIMIAASIGLGYEYAIEPFLGWYSGDIYGKQFHAFEASGWIAPLFWSLLFFNIAVPLTFINRKLRHREWYLFGASILINFGMFVERWVLTCASTAHDYLPHTWSAYISSWAELSITAGMFAFFALAILVLIRLIPIVPISDVKEEFFAQTQEKSENGIPELDTGIRIERVRPSDGGIAGSFERVSQLVSALESVLANSYRKVEVYSPFAIKEILQIFREKTSPVRIWTLIGALCGIGFGWFLTTVTAQENMLITGGKPPIAITPFWVTVFELGVLFGAVAALYSFIRLARLNKRERWPGFLPEYSRDRFGLFIACGENEAANIRSLLQQAGSTEIRDIAPLESGNAHALPASAVQQEQASRNG